MTLITREAYPSLWSVVSVVAATFESMVDDLNSDCSVDEIESAENELSVMRFSLILALAGVFETEVEVDISENLEKVLNSILGM